MIYTLPKNQPRETTITAIVAYLKTLSDDKQYVVNIVEETRSAAQNRYLWGVCYRTIVEFIRAHNGVDYSDEAVHETLKEQFLFSRTEQMKDREITIYKSTTKLTKSEFAEYIEHIFRWAAEFGCVIPEPDWGYRV